MIWNGEAYSYEWLLSAIKDWDNVLKKDNIIGKKVVAVESDYSPHAISLFLSLMKNKMIIAPINPKMPQSEKRKRIAVAEVEVIIRFINGESYVVEFTSCNVAHPLIKGLAGRSGLVLFSSGSTGEPKAMIHDLDEFSRTYKDRKLRSLKTLVFLMFDHIGGINTIFNIFSSCATAVLPINRDPEEICKLIEEYRIHVLPTSPTFLNLIMISGAYKRHDLSSLRLIAYGTEPMPKALLDRLKEAFPKSRLLQTFGTSETGIIKTRSRSKESLCMKFDDKNFEYKLVNGELWIKSRTRILGYLNQKDPFTPNGWFPTGDLVKKTEDGYIQIVGRKEEIINVGGQKVMPAEVESALLQMNEIKDVLVYGEPNPIIGQAVVAKVVLGDVSGGDYNKLVKKIKRHCGMRLQAYKVPVKIFKVDSLDYGIRFKKKKQIVV
ncbi:MAG: long-chain fatty acid--CoA ligase [Deltaproteobacteria bacterium]|nr:long-chain fatty acid--CoA ligase [Deltaproteobacteria bacterium]